MKLSGIIVQIVGYDFIQINLHLDKNFNFMFYLYAFDVDKKKKWAFLEVNVLTVLHSHS